MSATRTYHTHAYQFLTKIQILNLYYLVYLSVRLFVLSMRVIKERKYNNHHVLGLNTFGSWSTIIHLNNLPVTIILDQYSD